MEENITEEFLTFNESESSFLEAEQETIEAPKKQSRRRKKARDHAVCDPETVDGLQACPKVKRNSFEPRVRPLRRNVTKSKRGMPKIQ